MDHNQFLDFNQIRKVEVKTERLTWW